MYCLQNLASTHHSVDFEDTCQYESLKATKSHYYVLPPKFSKRTTIWLILRTHVGIPPPPPI